MIASGMPIDAWVAELSQIRPSERFVPEVTAFVRTHPISRKSLDPYAFFEEAHYTRNLIFKDEVFEVLALCWQPGHVSNVHNHRDQQCWMTMGEGRLECINYRVVERDPARNFCRLQPSTTDLITRATSAAIDEEEPIHRVVNCQHLGARALSVHVYSRPFDTCEIYCLDSNSYKDIKLSYWSEYGERTGTRAKNECSE